MEEHVKHLTHIILNVQRVFKDCSDKHAYEDQAYGTTYEQSYANFPSRASFE